MKTIVNLFWQICLLRQTPARVPTDRWFVTFIVVANLVCSVLVSVAFDSSPGLLKIATGILVGQAVTAGLVYFCVAAKNLVARFVTTITALFGCDLLITACLALVFPVAGVLGPAAISLVLLVFLIWSVVVAGFILHRALEVPMPLGIGISLGISLLSVTISQLAIGS